MRSQAGLVYDRAVCGYVGFCSESGYHNIHRVNTDMDKYNALLPEIATHANVWYYRSANGERSWQ
jgi:hypothetical protein